MLKTIGLAVPPVMKIAIPEIRATTPAKMRVYE
jgi:hypothetical protein